MLFDLFDFADSTGSALGSGIDFGGLGFDSVGDLGFSDIGNYAADWGDFVNDAGFSSPVTDWGSFGDFTYDDGFTNFNYGDALGTMDPASAAQIAAEAAEAGGITGIGWIDKVLGRIGEAWDEDPLSVINAGVGIAGIIDKMTKGGFINGGGGGGEDYNTASVDNLWAQRGGGQGGANEYAPVLNVTGHGATMFANPNVSQTIPIVRGRDPSQFVTEAPEGALTRIRR
jgi:hypothetical protein